MKNFIYTLTFILCLFFVFNYAQSQDNECGYDDFLAGPYRNAANKREIVMKCGQPHHIPGRQQVVSGGGQIITIGNEKWYYYFEDHILIFTFNNKGKLIKKDWKR